MNQNYDKLEQLALVLIILQGVGLIIARMVWKIQVVIPCFILVAEVIVVYSVIFSRRRRIEMTRINALNLISSAEQDAFTFGKLGLVTYDDNYIITSMSDLFIGQRDGRVGKKLLAWLPEADDLVSGKADKTTVVLDDHHYEIMRKEGSPILIFRDTTELTGYQKKFEEGQLVLGLINFDNYEESTHYEDEAEVASINSAVRTPLVDYAKEYGIVLRRINNYRYLMILNEQIFARLVQDRFSVVNKVRKAAQNMDVAITLTMAFARGTSNYIELDEMAVQLLELASSRGGDQVAVRKAGEDVKYYGGSSEAQEKRSRVRVRIIAHTLRDLIQKSSNVIICGHKEADFDCIGAAIGMARIVECYHKPVSIIAKTGGIESKLNEVLKDNKKQISERVRFVTESEAYNQLQDNTLVLMVDHNNIKQSNGAQVLENANKIAIIDHHRRGADFGVSPVLVYIEAGASSCSELVTEFIPYVSQQLDIDELEANIMLAGITVDTNRFKTRTGARTYDAASVLRKLGADPIVVDDYLKDNLEEFELKSDMMADLTSMGEGIIISVYDKKKVTRSLISQVANNLLNIQDVQASFVMAYLDNGDCAISARSNGKVNVQVIMEKMGGGGHMSQAALQRSNIAIATLKEELMKNINDYIRENTTSSEEE